jgi:hypothetical protein
VQPLDLQPQLRGAENINIFSAEQDGFVDKLAALRDHFVAWKKKHSKSYSSFSEEVQRMLIWIDNHGMLLDSKYNEVHMRSTSHGCQPFHIYTRVYQ